jgi:hypothetical protein
MIPSSSMLRPEAAGEMGGVADRQQNSQWRSTYLGCAHPTTIPYPGFWELTRVLSLLNRLG